jgi:hypothetical protein
MLPFPLQNTSSRKRYGSTPYRLCSSDSRVIATVYPGCPAYIYVTHDNLTDGEVDAALLTMTEQIPAPCCLVILPQCAASLLHVRDYG